MLKKMLLPLAAVFVTLGVLGACATMESSYQLPVSHPSAADLGEQPRTCTNCHDPQENGNVPYERFDHGSFWVTIIGKPLTRVNRSVRCAIKPASAMTVMPPTSN